MDLVMRQPGKDDAEGCAQPFGRDSKRAPRRAFLLAGEQGFEPQLLGPEPSVLPLDYSPTRRRIVAHQHRRLRPIPDLRSIDPTDLASADLCIALERNGRRADNSFIGRSDDRLHFSTGNRTRQQAAMHRIEL